MKHISEMTPEELLEYCHSLIKNGSNFTELANIFEKHNIEPDVRRNIVRSLESFEREQRNLREKNETKLLKRKAASQLLIGIGAVIFGFILFSISSARGGIFIFNFVVWGFGALMALRGIVGLTSTN